MPRETKTKEKKPVVPKTAAKARSVDGGEATIYNQKGEKSGTYLLPAEIFGLPWNADLVHQIMHSQQLNARANTAHTKDRGDVRGGGKKPWQQKGTGRARHGSRRSPIWVGGGVAHGPTVEKNYGRKINKKMREKALFTVLSQKVRDNEILFLSGLKLESPKTKLAREVLAGGSRNPRYRRKVNSLGCRDFYVCVHDSLLPFFLVHIFWRLFFSLTSRRSEGVEKLRQAL